MSDEYSGGGPMTVSYTLTREMYEYLMRIIGLGAFEGPIGDMKVQKDLEPVINALHIVLSGGRVTFDVEDRGTPDVKRELDERLARAARDSNDINKKAGYYVTLVA